MLHQNITQAYHYIKIKFPSIKLTISLDSNELLYVYNHKIYYSNMTN